MPYAFEASTALRSLRAPSDANLSAWLLARPLGASKRCSAARPTGSPCWAPGEPRDMSGIWEAVTGILASAVWRKQWLGDEAVHNSDLSFSFLEAVFKLGDVAKPANSKWQRYSKKTHAHVGSSPGWVRYIQATQTSCSCLRSCGEHQEYKGFDQRPTQLPTWAYTHTCMCITITIPYAFTKISVYLNLVYANYMMNSTIASP